MNEDYEAWLVDLDGTLYRPLGVKLAMGAELLTGPGVIPLLRAFRHEHERLREEGFASDSRTPFEEQLGRAAKVTGANEQDVRRAVTRWMVDKPCKWIRLFRRKTLLDEIQAFRANGGKTALVSDYPARSKLRALRAEALFDTVVANGEPDGPSALKPSPEGYLAAARRLGIDASRCLVIGDRDDADGEAARRAGMGFRLV
jgi:putative hydrolase of the HAD superfamily